MNGMLKRLGGNDCPDGRSCPAIHEVAGQVDYVVQGWTITDPEILAELDLPPGESAVRIPASLVEVIRNAGRR